MTARLLAFAHAADLAGFRERDIEYDATETLRALVGRLAPGLPTESARIAVDQEYRDWDSPVGPASEIAIIPPVSGG